METKTSILENHIPPSSLAYCLELWNKYGFDLRLRKSRVSKAGDFTIRSNRPVQITINQDLEPYLFLITYLHEVAHHEVHLSFGRRAESHGSEWKQAFQRMIAPVLNDSVFPADLLLVLREHMKDPMATNFSDRELMKVLRGYDPRSVSQLLLADIPEGSVFGIRGKWFRKGKTKRTRALCHELKSKRKYFVPVDLAVENVQLALGV